MRAFRDISELSAAIGEELGVSKWLVMDQGRIDGFAGVTKDDYWLHVDPDRAAENSVLGRTVAHGLLTLSLMTHLSREIWSLGTMTGGLNYGYDGTRFPSPVFPGDRVRLKRSLVAVDQRNAGWLVRFGDVMQIEGKDKPACVAENLCMFDAR